MNEMAQFDVLPKNVVAIKCTFTSEDISHRVNRGHTLKLDEFH